MAACLHHCLAQRTWRVVLLCLLPQGGMLPGGELLQDDPRPQVLRHAALKYQTGFSNDLLGILFEFCKKYAHKVAKSCTFFFCMTMSLTRIIWF